MLISVSTQKEQFIHGYDDFSSAESNFCNLKSQPMHRDPAVISINGELEIERPLPVTFTSEPMRREHYLYGDDGFISVSTKSFYLALTSQPMRRGDSQHGNNNVDTETSSTASPFLTVK
jgi:hypothetical protein